MTAIHCLRFLPACSAVITFLIACSNSVTMSGESSYNSTTFKGFMDSTAESFSQDKTLSSKISNFLVDPSVLISHLDEKTVVAATSDGKSVVVNLDDLQASEKVVSLSESSEKPEWIVGMGDDQYWALAGGKIYLHARVGSEAVKIEEKIKAILDEKAPGLKPLFFDKTNLIGIYKKHLLWLSADPQLKREFYQKFDSLGLESLDKNAIAGAGLIRDRGIWLLSGDYIFYVLRDSKGQFSSQRKRYRGISVGKDNIVPKKMSMILAPNSSGVIKTEGRIFAMSDGGVYLSGAQKQPIANPAPEVNETATAVASTTEKTKETSNRPTATELEKMYNDKFKALIDDRCQSCHSGGKLPRLGSFQNVKDVIGTARIKVEGNSMPPPASNKKLSDSERTDLVKFLSDVEFLP